MRWNKQIDVSRTLAVAGFFNFLCSCANACLLPFLTLYFRQLGLNPAMAGIIMGTKHLITLVWCPISSLLAEHYNKRRTVINASVASSALVVLIVLLLPPADVGAELRACNMSDLKSDNLLITTKAAAVSPSTFITPKSRAADTQAVSVTNNLTLKSPTELNRSSSDHGFEANIPTESVSHSSASLVRKKRSYFPYYLQEKEVKGPLDFLAKLKKMDAKDQSFFLVLIIVSVWELASAPLEWTADDGLHDHLDFADASDRYVGSSRTGWWGLLGAAIGVGGSGLLVNHLKCHVVRHMPRSAMHFFCYSALAALILPVAMFLPLNLNKKREKLNRLVKAMQLVHGSPRAVLCLATTLLFGMAISTAENFLLWEMQDHGSTELHMGLSLAAALLAQACYPVIAARVSRLLSSARLLTVGAAILALQIFYYSFLWGPWAALPAQVMSCFSVGGFWWAVKIQCNEVATPGAERSVSRLYRSLVFHLGCSFGSFGGGFVAHKIGLLWLFRGVALVLILWCVSLPFLQLKAPRQHRINYSRLLAADASEASDSGSDQERDWLDKAMADDRSNNNYGRRINH
ncbi:major facilitator superfamily domain-containing protein 6-like [Neosynchiropus ocellatus]